MTDDQEDRLDLSAWEAPEPPTDLADGVIARIGGTGIVASVPDEQPQPRRRAWLIAGIAAATLVAAAGVLMVARGTHRAAPTSGSVIADQARSLSLDSVHADLDPGAQVAWHRRGGALQVSQRTGAVAWRVSGDERLVIDAGATVASVEATGASLRVEVKMNQTDARVIGGAALTAAVVALVTVVVYEGHVKVSGAPGQPTVIVQPGSTYTVTPPTTKLVEAPVVGVGVDPDPDTVTTLPTPADLRVPSGESATIHATEFPVGIQLDMWGQCSVTVDDMLQTDTTVFLDEGKHSYRLDCKMAYNDDAVARVEAQAQSGKTGTFTLVRDDARSAISDDGPVLRIEDVKWESNRTIIRGEALGDATLSARTVNIPVLDGRFLASVPNDRVMSLRLTHPQRGVHYYVFRATKTVAAAPRTCDATKLRDQALDRINLGQHAAALALFERALACKPGDAALVRLAFTSACNSLDEAKAKQYYAKLSATDQLKYGQICVRNSIDVSDSGPKAPCDAEAAKEKGMTNINMGQHAAALAQFEASLRCKHNPYVLQLAFMESCASGNTAKANLYYPKLTRDQREKFRQICIRQRPPVKLVEPDGATAATDAGVGYLQVTTKPTAKVLIDGKDTGLETPVSGKQLELTAGKHKVTFVIGDDRFTYPVVIEAGATATMTKDLR